MKKRFKTIIAIGLTFATILGCSVTTWAASTDATVVGTDNGKKTVDQTQEPNDLPFLDVSVNDWFYPAVKALYEGRDMMGDPGKFFHPNGVMRRAEIVTVLYRMEDKPETVYENRFPDVLDQEFYTKPVMWASSKDVKVVNGYADNTFGPADYITREQMATMLYRYAEYKGYDVSADADLESFPDSDKVSKFAEKEMKWAVGAGLIKGDNGQLNPQGITSRAVGATIIHRFSEEVAGK